MAYPGASTSYLPIAAFQRNWIADGVGALGQESQPSMSNVRLCVRLKGTGVAVYWGGGVGVGVCDGAAVGARAPPVGPAFPSSPPQAARVEQAKIAVAQSKALRACMVLPVIVNPLRCISKAGDVAIGTLRSVADHDPETVGRPRVRVFPSDRDFPGLRSKEPAVDRVHWTCGRKGRRAGRES